MSQLTYEEFKKSMPSMDDAFSEQWNMSEFKIQCQKCNSDKTYIFLGADLIGGGGGCETCGYGGESEATINITVKCGACGHAMIIIRSSTR